jgi:hypothetical protein
MLNQLPVAMLLARKGVVEMHSALPDAPVVTEPAPAEAHPRTYRTRTAVASRLARLADLVGPVDFAHSR